MAEYNKLVRCAFLCKNSLLVLNSFVFVGPSSINGQGIFTNKTLKIGELVHYIEPLEFKATAIEEVAKWNDDKRKPFLHFAYSDGVYYYYKESDNSFYMNHSCDPNCWFQTDSKIVTRKEVGPNEELTIDYATLMSPHGLDDSFECNCQSAKCRRIVTKTDCTIPNVLNDYQGHFLSFIEITVSNKSLANLRNRLRTEISKNS